MALPSSGRDEARRGDVVDEHGVAVVDAVTLRALVHADAAGPLLLGGGVRVEHVAAQLGDEHPPIAVERDRAGADDLGLRHHQLEVVARRQDETGLLLFRGERLDRLLRREVGADLARSDAVDAAALAGAGDGRPPLLRHDATGWPRTPPRRPPSTTTPIGRGSPSSRLSVSAGSASIWSFACLVWPYRLGCVAVLPSLPPSTQRIASRYIFWICGSCHDSRVWPSDE